MKFAIALLVIICLSPAYLVLQAEEKEIPNVPKVNRKVTKKTNRNAKVYFHLPIIGDVLMNRTEDLRINLLDSEKDKAVIDKHRLPIWSLPNRLREKEEPAAYGLVRNRLIEFYTKSDEESGDDAQVYRVDLHFEPIHHRKMDGLMGHFRYIRYEVGDSSSIYFRGIYRSGNVHVTVHVRRHGKYIGARKSGIPNSVEAISPFVMTMELSPVEWYALKNRPPDSVLAAMRKGEIHLGMFKREVKVALARRYKVDWGEGTARVNKGKASYTIHFEDGVVKSLTR